MADNHYNPLPLHDFKVGESVLYEFVDRSLRTGIVSGFIGPRMVVIQDDENMNNVVGRRFKATVPYNHIWRLP